jgi:hypothetical protein
VAGLSIVFLAAEVVRKRQGETVLTERYPWAVAFGYGLIHGLGFAGALSQIGIPEDEMPLALLMFNLGVEAGQIAFVAVVNPRRTLHCIRDRIECSAWSWFARYAACSDFFFLRVVLNCRLMPAKI